MAEIYDNNANQLPDILEQSDFNEGDILTAETMNQVLAAIKGTYDILTRAPELEYLDEEGFGQGEIKQWNTGEDMYVAFKFTSSVYGQVTVTVVQTDVETGVQKTKTVTVNQGVIRVSFGKAPSDFGRYTYKVSGVDFNGRTAAKELEFTQIAGGFIMNSDLDTKLKNYYFVTDTDIVLTFEYTLKYVGLEQNIIKKLACYIDDGSAIDPSTKAYEVTSDRGEISFTVSTSVADTVNLILWGQVIDATNGNIVKEETIEYPLYFSDDENKIVILFEDLDLNDLNTDSRVEIQYRVQWFKEWENLNIYTIGQLYDSNDNLISGKSATTQIKKNNDLASYKIIGFPYYSSEIKEYYIKLGFDCTGSNKDLPAYIDATSPIFTVVPGQGIEYVVKRGETEILLANFDAKTNQNSSDEPNVWRPTQGIKADQWKISLNSLSCNSPQENEKWEDMGSGWKESEKEEIYPFNYLHLKHNAYGVLMNDTTDTKVDLANEFKQGFSLETYVKTDYLSNVQGYNLTCLNSSNSYGVVMTPQKTGVLTNINIDNITAQQNNITTVLDGEWIHVVYVISPLKTETTEPTLSSEINQIELYEPNEAYVKTFVNGVLVKMAKGDQTTLAEVRDCYLYLNNYVDELNSGYESNSQFQFLRLYKTALTGAEVRQNYASCLNQEQKQNYNARNNVENPNIPKIIFETLPSSSNGFVAREGGAYAIDEFTPNDKKANEETGFPGASKVYVDCSMQYYAPGMSSPEEVFAKVSVQGTSSLGYPVKNYKITVYTDDDFSEKQKDYVPLEKRRAEEDLDKEYGVGDWHGDATYTFKCDFMEHSHKNNTPTAMFYNKILLNNILFNNDNAFSPARKNGYNDAIDGFPILLYRRERASQSNPTPELEYMGTYMFNTDKAGLDQGFQIPASEEAIEYEFEYYEGEEKKIHKFKSSYIPCVSYEGGTNNDFSAATFLPFSDYNQQREIVSTIYTDEFDDEYAYFEETLEPRFSCFKEEKKKQDAEYQDVPASVLYSPLKRAIDWLDEVWPTHIDDSELKRKNLLGEGNSEIKALGKWGTIASANGSITYNETNNTLRLTSKTNNLRFVYNVPVPVDQLYKLYIYTKPNSADTIANNWSLEIIDVEHQVQLLNKKIPNGTDAITFNCDTNQAKEIQLVFVANQPDTLVIDLSSMEFLQTGPNLLQRPLNNTTIDVERVKEEFHKYFSFEYCLAYYLQALAFTQADNIGKNAMFDSWYLPDESSPTGYSWSPLYPRPYDMDSQMGLNNQGQDTILTSAEVNALLSPDSDAALSVTPHRRFVNQYAVSFSKLWILFGYVFKANVQTKYDNLRENIYTVETIKNAIEPYTTDSIGEIYYNCDANRKYVSQDNSQWKMCAGNRYHRFYSFLHQRFEFLDGFFQKGDWGNHFLKLRTTSDAAMTTAKTSIPTYLQLAEDTKIVKTAYADTTTFPSLKFRAVGNNKNCDLLGTGHLLDLDGITNMPLEELVLHDCNEFQKIYLYDQRNMQTLNLDKQVYLKKIQLYNSNISKLELPSNLLQLNEFTAKGINAQGALGINNSGLIKIDISNTPYSSLTLQNSPVQEIVVGEGSALTSLVLENCYQLTELTDNTWDNREFKQKFSNLKSLGITNCSKLTKIEIIKSKITSLTLDNCNNLKTLILTECTALKDLDLSGLSQLEKLDVSGCTALKTIHLPKTSALTNINLSGCTALTRVNYNIPVAQGENELSIFDFSRCGLITKLKLSYTKPAIIQNLEYNGNGDNMFYNCSALRILHNVNLTLQTSGSYIFSKCSLLGKSLSTDAEMGYSNPLNVIINTSPTVTSLSHAFQDTPRVTYQLLYDLAIACPASENFYGYFYADSEDTINHGEWPSEVKNNGFFAVKNGNTYTRRAKAFSVGLFFYGNSTVNGAFPSNFFMHCMDESGNSMLKDGSLLAFFRGTKITSINLQAILQNTNASDIRSMCYECSSLTSIGDFTTTNSFNITLANGTFYGCTAFGNNAQALGLLEKLEHLVEARYMFYNTALSDLRRDGIAEGNIKYPLFYNNTKITRIDGMFSNCENLIKIPKKLFTITSGTVTHRNLAGLHGLFSKSPAKFKIARLEIRKLDSTFLQGINPNVFTSFGIGSINSSHWGVGFSTSSTPGGTFCGADIDKISIKNLIDYVAPHIKYLNDTFKNTIGFTECEGILRNCTSLIEAPGLFEGSTIEVISGSIPLFPVDSNNKITSIASMFKNTPLQKLNNINLSDCKKVTTMSQMFYNCYDLGKGTDGSSAPFSNIDLPNSVTNTSSMFYNCLHLGCLSDKQLEVEIASSTNIIAIPKSMFENATRLSNASYMFANCYSLYGTIEEDLFKNCKQLADVHYIFSNCQSLRGAIPQMFTYTDTDDTTLDEYTLLTDVSYMFNGCGYLTDPFAERDISKALDVYTLIPTNFFNKCPNINNAAGLCRFVGNGGSVFISLIMADEKGYMASQKRTLQILSQLPGDIYYRVKGEKPSVADLDMTPYSSSQFYKQIKKMSTWVWNTTGSDKAQRLLSLNCNLFLNHTELTNIQEAFSGLGMLHVDNLVNLAKNSTKLTNAIGCFSDSYIRIGNTLKTFSTLELAQMPFYNVERDNTKLRIIALFAQEYETTIGKLFYNRDSAIAYASKFTLDKGASFFYKSSREDNNIFFAPVPDNMTYSYINSSNTEVEETNAQLTYWWNDADGSYHYQYYKNNAGANSLLYTDSTTSQNVYVLDKFKKSTT